MSVEHGSEGAGSSIYLDDETIAARARALSSPVRWRVLRACLDEALTNKELADLLGVNPGSMLHHVRTLVATGFLRAEEPRRGQRNAVEIPYRTTDLVWAAGRSTAGFGDFLLEEIEVAQAQGEATAWRTLMRLSEDDHGELRRRLEELLDEFRTRGEGMDADAGRSWSIVVSLRPHGA